MRRILLGFCAAVLASMPVHAEQVLKIGFVNTFTGGGAVIGRQQRAGFDLALEQLKGQIGGLKTEVIYEDDKMRPDAGVAVAEKLIKQDKVNVIVGVIWSNVQMAMLPQVSASKVFLISTGGGPGPLAGKMCNPYYFNTGGNNDQVPEALGQLLNDKGVKEIFLMAPNYQAGKDMLAGFRRTYKGQVQGEILTNLGQSDYQPEISQLRAKNPKAVFVFYPGAMGIAFMKQWAASGIGANAVLYSGGTVDWSTLPAIGKDAVGTFHTIWWSPDLPNAENKKFVASFQEKFKFMPEHYAVQGYDAVMLLDHAVRQVKGNLENPDAFRGALRKAEFNSVRGPFKFNTNHFPIQDILQREVVLGADGALAIVTRGVVLKAHKDSYHQDCAMKW
jgi:branched-chain amino acid transport system substrate-binding protein